MLYYFTFILGVQPAVTQTTSRERECLARYARKRKLLVEIGVWHGVNTRLLRQQMDEHGRLYAIDPFPRGRFNISWEKLIAVREANVPDRGEVHFLEMLSGVAAERFRVLEPGEVDFLFIDGDHSYDAVKQDWYGWSPKIAVGGIIALHDSRSYDGRSIEGMGSARFTREVILHDSRFRTVETCDSLTVLERVPG